MSWILHCPWCKYALQVFPRGGRGRDQGAGVEAADLMRAHVETIHDKTWREAVSAMAS